MHANLSKYTTTVQYIILNLSPRVYCFFNQLHSDEYTIVQGRPTIFSRGPNLLFQKFRGPKFSLTLSSSSQTKVFRWISWWFPKKKRSSLRFDRFFPQKTRWRPKKKVFTQVLIVFFCQKASEHTHTKKGHSDGFCGIFQKASTKETQGLVSATHNVSAEVSINQPMQKPLVRATLKPLAGHLWPAGRVLDAPVIV